VRNQPGVRSAAPVVALGVAIATSALAPPSAAAGDPDLYRSESARFSVDFSGKPPVIRELTGSKFSTTTNDVNYAVIVDGVEFSVEIHDIPRFAKMVLTDHYILDQSVSGKLEDIGAREVDAAETTFQGEPARDVAFEAPDRAFVGRMFLILAGHRLYLAGVLHPPSLDPRAASARFFASFSFWPE
jgi:hypothetical protein